MLSLRCVRLLGWPALLSVLVACSNGRGSVDEQSQQPPPAQGAQEGFTVGGTVSGLAGSGLVLQNNGAGDLQIAGDGSFTFASKLATGMAYNVAVVSQPTSPAQTCTIARGSGSIATANVSDIAVTCATGQFSVRGTVSGLSGSGLVLQNNGSGDRPISADGPFTFGGLVDGSGYTVTVRTQPSGQTCLVSNPSGTIRGADAGNVEVACTSSGFTIGGNAAGVAGTGLSLQLNGANDLAIVGSGPFAFSKALQSGAGYVVTVRRQPSNPVQSCTVGNGAGTVSGSNVTNVAINCVSRSFTVGGTVSGLAGSGLIVQLNGDGDLPILANGRFTFDEAVPSGARYRVNVAAQPTNPTQVCTVASGAGTIGSANVSNVRITCSASAFAVGGTVIGLQGSGLVLQNNGSDDLPVSADGQFRFPTTLASGATYRVTVLTPPANPGQACTVTNGQGTVGGGDVGNVVVSCNTSDFSVGGTVRNLEGSGLVLRNNGGDDLSIDGNGSFAFGTALPSGARYDVTIASQPNDPTQVCTVSNGSGSVGQGNVTSIVVDCETQTEDFSVGGRVTRLRGTGLIIQNNGSDDLSIAADGRFTFPTRLPRGSPYNVTIRQQPERDRCEVRHGAGTIRDRDVGDVEVRCDRHGDGDD
ncbi:MAG TPA: hypothetical protein VJQ52_15295 [Steroidobacteraceae bacterium]|nr:hypothetical protein [Steroidobacteraceae bacterium]